MPICHRTHILSVMGKAYQMVHTGWIRLDTTVHTFDWKGDTHMIPAKGQLKMMNSTTFGIKISWPKMMIQCFPRIYMDALRPPLLIYAPENSI